MAQGNPVPTYRWHKVAGELRTLPDLGSTVRQEGGVLVFPKVVAADAGTYICEVTNSVGQDKVEAELIVEGKRNYYNALNIPESTLHYFTVSSILS